MRPITLEQFKENLFSEKADIERLIEKEQHTLSNLQRIEKIKDMLHAIEIMDKPDSLYKKAMRL